MGSENGASDEKPVHTVNLDAFWIDKTEVTNAMYSKCVNDGKCNPPRATISYTRESYYGNSEFDNYPVIYVDWNMAKAYCEWVDHRLPTEAEWEKTARGESAFVYPWGNDFDGTKVNFCDKNCSYDGADKSSDDGFADTAPVGSYLNGASPYGALDMAGNVWEWVNDWYDVYPGGDPNASSDFGQKYRVQRGGTWFNDSGNVRSLTRWGSVPTDSENVFGFRCALSADEQAEPNTSQPSSTEVQGTPIPGIGSTIISTKDGMTLLYVPAGEFTMGSEEGDSDEKQGPTVNLDSFWIDKTEVTNAMYSKCVNNGSCNPPVSTKSYTRDNYYGNAEFDNYPVIYVDWNMAKAYCEWVDRRLPTEAEWEKAARGTDGRIYPWANDTLSSNLLNYDDNVGDTTEVGNYPDGASPYGALDMAGNVWEWVADWYDANYYAMLGENASNPQGPASGQYRVLRGGSWINRANHVRSADRGWFEPEDFYYVGFRCSRSP
jgi:formylglycine-generating enzyme required for sulfatase activity